MAEIKVTKLESASKLNKRELYASIAYMYPQYTLKQVQALPARDVILLYDQARKLQAMNYINLVHIAAAPHTDKGKAVKSLLNEFQKILKD